MSFGADRPGFMSQHLDTLGMGLGQILLPPLAVWWCLSYNYVNNHSRTLVSKSTRFILPHKIEEY